MQHYRQPMTRLARHSGSAAVLTIGLVGCAGGDQIKPRVPYDSNAVVSASSALPLDSSAKEVLREQVLTYLQQMAADTYAGYRANAIEALQADADAGEAVARSGILDSNLGVRFVSTMAIGQHQYSDAAPLVHALLNDSDDSVRAAAIFALKRNGFAADLGPLAAMLKDPSLRTRANAALVLGELGDSSAVPMLQEALGYPNPRATIAELHLAELQIAEAMVRLGDDTALPRIRTQLYSRDPSRGEVVALAVTILGRLKDQQSKGEFVKLVAMWREFRNSAEVRLAAMAALAQLGDPPPLELVMEYLDPTTSSQYPVGVRVQAVNTLGHISSPEAIAQIATSFHQSREEFVRLQAGAWLLRHLGRDDEP